MGFTCSLSATAQDACLETKDNDGTDCVWCAFSSVGPCMSEAQSETAEATVPGIQCTRNTDSDDDNSPATDNDDDATPTDDDSARLVYRCLKLKDSQACDAKEGCSLMVSVQDWQCPLSRNRFRQRHCLLHVCYVSTTTAAIVSDVD